MAQSPQREKFYCADKMVREVSQSGGDFVRLGYLVGHLLVDANSKKCMETLQRPLLPFFWKLFYDSRLLQRENSFIQNAKITKNRLNGKGLIKWTGQIKTPN